MRLVPLIAAFLLASALITSKALAHDGEPQLLSLYRYKPIYLLMGNPYTKIQISFKTQVIEDVPVHFGYSQLMLWDLFVSSPYFYDINYNPLAWYRIHIDREKEQWLDLIPWEHESNGKGGSDERSWDRVAIAYHQQSPISERMKLYWELKAWVPLHYNPNNTDLAQYRGLWEANLTLSDLFGPFFDFNDLTLRIYPGGKSLINPLRGGQELTLRLKSAHRKFLPLVIGQIFHGYGEYLLDYQREHWGFRAGLGF